MTDDVDAARALLASRRCVVLDFDGPVTRLLPGEEYLRVTEGAREIALSRGVPLDDELAAQTDHVQLLRLVARRDPAAGRAVERWCTARELAAARSAAPFPGVAAFVTACQARGTAVAVVTNNAPTAVAEVLARGGAPLAPLPVHGRDPEALDRLKPAPALVLDALRDVGVGPEEAVMVGDSPSDVEAAAAAVLPCLGLSPSSARRTELRAAGAVAAVPDLAALLPAPF